MLFVWLFTGNLKSFDRPLERTQQVRLVLQRPPAPQPTPPPARAVPKPPPARAQEAPPEPPIEVAALQPVPRPSPRPTIAPRPTPRPSLAPDLPTPATPAPTPPPDPTPDPAAAFMEEQRRRIAEIRERYRSQVGEKRRQVHEQRRELDKRLGKLEIATEAASHFSNYKGARVGAIRTLNLDSAPDKAAQEVMARYNIRVGSRYVEAGAPSFLNSAASGGNVYRPSNQPGFYEVFVISKEAQKRMWWLETNYLKTHGYEPGSAIVDTVEFGVVRGPDGKWDLGILNIEIRPVRGALDTPDPRGP